jgi:hypothetical protein
VLPLMGERVTDCKGRLAARAEPSVAKRNGWFTTS